MTNDFMLLMPLILITAGAISLMLAAAYEKVTIEQAAFGCMGIFGVAFLVQLSNCITGHVAPYETVFNNMLVISNFTRVAGLIILGCGFFTAMSAQTYFKQNNFCTTEFYSLVTFSACGMLLLTMVQELISVFVALEIMSLAIYILVGYDRKNKTAAEAVMKYLMLGAFAGAFFTMGAALIYGGAHSTQFSSIGQFVAEKGFFNNPALVAGSFFVIVAFLFKAAAFPFHAWVIDVYDGASAPITGYMATGLKTAIFAVFANFLVADETLRSSWVTYLFYFSIFTMFVGNLIAIGQDTLKRMLAASGIVHTGYLLIALVAVSAENFSGNVILYYLAAYAVGTLGIFAALSYLGGDGEKRQSFDDFKGLARVRPFSAAAITIFLLSMAGIPPTAGFMGKFFIITSAIDAGQIALAVFGIISSILSMWYYLRLVINMYFHEATDSFEDTTSNRYAPVGTFILAACVFVIGLYPVII
ncbi:NADH-quinone oxidoreductase subunit N [Desulfogranum marinum]|uniref:NADH-quinone oxidoreductase subunit N n=1 Tax=Desulfogranum marinum TaxID=453220 RepID=UPI0019632D4B|nr:NADH-quinone oxidoreductase subunit N [Desulfogranum marinum]MBM9512573.1 NADH-quinone oxidoreductase subunit N [Desulfogranum marinum]